jgi:hypothetical protein
MFQAELGDELTGALNLFANVDGIFENNEEIDVRFSSGLTPRLGTKENDAIESLFIFLMGIGSQGRQDGFKFARGRDRIHGVIPIRHPLSLVEFSAR